MSETPETDKSVFREHPTTPEVVFAHFARHMETQRNQARRKLKEAWEEVADSCDSWLNSIVQEAAVDFIKGMRDYARDASK
jgi:predicted nucleic acid-binding protein